MLQPLQCIGAITGWVFLCQDRNTTVVVQPILMQQPMFIPPVMMQQPYAVQPMAVQQPYAVQPMMMQNVYAVQNPQTMQQLQLMQSQSKEQYLQQFQTLGTQGPGPMGSRLRDFEHMQPALSIHEPASMQPNCTSQTSTTIGGNDMYAVVHVNDEEYKPMQRAAVNERIDDPPPNIKS